MTASIKDIGPKKDESKKDVPKIFLKQDQLVQMKDQLQQINETGMEIAIANLKSKNFALKKELAIANSQVLENQQIQTINTAKGLASKLNGLRAMHENFRKEIAKEYGLGDRWGFEPLTGEIDPKKKEKINPNP